MLEGSKLVNDTGMQRDAASITILRLGEGHLALFQIDIGPIQPDGFARASTGIKQEDDKRS